MIRNPAKLREPSKEEGIISSTDSKSVCSQEVITNLRPETYTQSLLNVPNGDLVAVKINASNVQTNGQGIKESKREVAFTCVFKNRILYSNRPSRCRNCGGGDRGRVAIYRPFGELRRAKIVLSPVWCSRPTTGVPLAHATMNFVGLDLTASDRWHQTTTTTTKVMNYPGCLLLLNR
ncbi:hypothetical protein TNCV_4430171 [Trichonephila clavipes]|nr:hypothetical protein TNCV_4430171 [Trichonephila clavipes]